MACAIVVELLDLLVDRVLGEELVVVGEVVLAMNQGARAGKLVLLLGFLVQMIGLVLCKPLSVKLYRVDVIQKIYCFSVTFHLVRSFLGFVSV